MRSGLSMRETRLTICKPSVLILTALPVTAQPCAEPVGRWAHGPALAVAISGSTAYVSSGAALVAIDVTDSAQPARLGEVTLPDIVWGVAAAGPYAYAAMSAGSPSTRTTRAPRARTSRPTRGRRSCSTGENRDAR